MALNEITKGMSNAAEQINGNFQQLEKYVGDTGWVPLTIKSPWIPRNNEAKWCRYRKVGNMVQLVVQINATSAVDRYSASLVDLPKDLIPIEEVQGIGVTFSGPYANQIPVTLTAFIDPEKKSLDISGPMRVPQVGGEGRWLSIIFPPYYVE